MREYYVFLSHGITVDQPLWSEPYEDAWVSEDLMTVTFPIYFEDPESGIRVLLGVAGTDISLEYL